jgi:pyruvate formate lyase activating enzyme
MSAWEAVAELLRDRSFFGPDGGVTVSGGEACLQATFVHEVLGRLRSEGIGTALDTCGMCTESQLLRAAEHADLVLYDIKDDDPDRHLRNTGGDLAVVLRNFRLLARPPGDRARNRDWVRTPIIPGLADSPGMIQGIARFLADVGGDAVERWELCAFNNLCREKYRQLGGEWELAASPLMESDDMDRLVDTAIRAGWPAARIRWTGMSASGGTAPKDRPASPLKGEEYRTWNEEAPCARERNP